MRFRSICAALLAALTGIGVTGLSPVHAATAPKGETTYAAVQSLKPLPQLPLGTSLNDYLAVARTYTDDGHISVSSTSDGASKKAPSANAFPNQLGTPAPNTPEQEQELAEAAGARYEVPLSDDAEISSAKTSRPIDVARPAVPSNETSPETQSLLASNDFPAWSFAECKADPRGHNLGHGIIYSHFKFCQWYSYGFAVFVNNGYIGSLTFTTITVGVSNVSSRDLLLNVTLDDVVIYGTAFTLTSYLTVQMGTAGWPNANSCGISGAANPFAQTVLQWMGNDWLAYAVAGPKGLGSGLDDVSTCVAQLYGAANSTAGPVGWNLISGEFGMRFDSASYTKNGELSEGGAIFNRTIPVLLYSRDEPSIRPVTDHIRQVYDGFTTHPGPSGAQFPGDGAVPGSAPLTRLFPNYDSVAYDLNRARKDQECASLTGFVGEDCDEFPFASTYQGGASGQPFSVRYLDATGNQKAGNALNQFYVNQRILHTDKFFVDAVGSPSYVNRSSGKCIAPAGGSSANGTAVIQTSCNHSRVQDWLPMRNADGTIQLVNRQNGKCLEVYNSSTDNNAPVVQWDCNGNNNQRWSEADRTLPGDISWLNRNSMMCLATTDNSTAEGAPLAQRGCDQADIQRWNYYAPIVT